MANNLNHMSEIKKFGQDDITKIRMKTEKFENQVLFEIPENHFNNVLFIMGDTRSGKSTTFLSFKGQPLISVLINGERDLKVQTENQLLKQKIIGHGSISNTKQPNVFYHEKNKLLIVDCPGLNDSNGLVDEFLNKFYIMKLFSRTKKARFLLVIPQWDIQNDNKKPLKNCINGYLKYFNLQETNFQKIISHTSLLISKVGLKNQQTHSNYKKQYLIKKIETLIDIFQKQNENYHHQLFQHFKNNFNSFVYIFQKPLQENKKISNLETFQHEKTNPFLEINFKKDINYQLRKIQNPEENQQQKENMKKMAQIIVQKIKKNLKIIMNGITQQCQMSKESPSRQCQTFKNELQKFIKFNDIYYASPKNRFNYINVQFEQIRFTLRQFNRILFLSKIMKICIEFHQIQKIKQRVMLIIKQFATNFFYAWNQFHPLYNFLYILYKYFDELEMIKSIFPELSLKMQELQGIICLTYNIIKLKDSFIENFQINKYYLREDAAITIKCLQDQFFNVSLKQFELAFKKQKLLTSQINKKYQIYMNKIVISIAKISSNIGNYDQAFQVLEKQRNKIEETGYIQEDSLLRSNYVQIYYLLGILAKQNLQRYRLAIQYFKTIKQFNQVSSIYNKIINQLQLVHGIQKSWVLIEYSQFLLDTGKQIEAQNYLQIARQLTINPDQRDKIGKMIQNYEEKGPQKRKKHISCLHKTTQSPNESLILKLTTNKEKQYTVVSKKKRIYYQFKILCVYLILLYLAWIIG